MRAYIVIDPDYCDPRKVYVVPIDQVLTLDEKAVVISEEIFKPPDKEGGTLLL